MAGSLLAGTATLAVNGQTFALVGDFKYRVAKVARTSLLGMDGYHGTKAKPIPGMIGAKLRDTGGLSVAAINAMDGVVVTAILANGKTIVGRSMASVTPDGETVASEDAELDVTWEGPDVSEN